MKKWTYARRSCLLCLTFSSLFSVSIDAKSPEINTSTISVSQSLNQNALQIMKNRWKANLVGDFQINSQLLNDSDIKQYINDLSVNALSLYRELNQTQERTYLWQKLATDTRSADLTTQFKNLAILAKAYGTQGTSLYQQADVKNAIISGLDFITDSGRYDGHKYYGNWWDWQIGIPQQFMSILFILDDQIPMDKLNRYTNIMLQYLPNPYQQMYGKAQDIDVDLEFIPNFKNSGANRTDEALSFLGLGILTRDSAKIDLAVNSVKDIFELVDEKDGFYADGSFVQHYDIPYTGAYGNHLVKGVGNIFGVVAGTKWQLDSTILDQFVNNIEKAFIPLMVNGEMMSMVNGRAITRPTVDQQWGFGSVTPYNLLLTSEFANSEDKHILRQAAKFWMFKNPTYYYVNTRDFKDLLMTKNVMADQTIDISKKPFIGSHMYAAMDRFVYSDDVVNVGISLYSKRMSAFEAGNGENKRGWHTSDGMVYLCNGDQQFGMSYWPTVDFYRLPGTTVDTRPLEDEVTSFQSFVSNEDFVGGVTNNNDAVVAMFLNKQGFKNNDKASDMDLQVKKSWFVVDGKIIALGAGITDTTSANLETVIENRMLDANNGYQLIDSSNKQVSNSLNHNATRNSWLLLQGTDRRKNIGYVMLADQIINTVQEERKGSYQTINSSGSDKIYQEKYQKIIIEHGQSISNGSYAYMIYPGASKDLLNKVVDANDWIIESNNQDIQIVKNNHLQTVGATIWHEQGAVVEGISVNAPVIMLIKMANNQLELNIANPKQNAQVFKVVLPQKIVEIITQDPAIKIKDKQILEIDTKGALGKTFSLTVKLATK